MDLWRAVGRMWDTALDGAPLAAATQCDALLAETVLPERRTVLLAFRAFCELLQCRHAEGLATAFLATAEAPVSGLPRFYAESMLLLATSMVDSAAPGAVATFEHLRNEVAFCADAGPDALLAVHPLIESAVASGRFAAAEDLVRRFPADPDASSSSVASWVRLQLARSLLFRGRLDDVVAECTALRETAPLPAHPQLGMLIDALLCYTAAQRGDRREVDLLGTRILATVKAGDLSYVSVGCCLLLSWSLSATGQVQRSAALLQATAGGPGLERIKTWDRAFGYELLLTAALQRGDLAAARGWAARAVPLARFEVAAAAVDRALSRLAAAEGQSRDALERALSSARRDAANGARIDELRSKILVARAHAASGDHERAAATLGATCREAELLGAAGVRLTAARELRALRSHGGGWESLTAREREIVALAAEGHSNRTIGTTLFISDRTVQSHLSRALRALGVRSRAALPAALPRVSSRTPAALTARQQHVASLVARGSSNAAIAAELGISSKTVEKHLAAIFQRWQVASRTAIAMVELGRR